MGVLVDRRGDVQHVMVGNNGSTELPDWGRLRAGRGRLRGLRCLKTHLRDEGLSRDDLTDLAVLRLDAMVSVSVQEDGLPGLAHTAFLAPANDEGRTTERIPPTHPADLDLHFGNYIRELETELSRSTEGHAVEDGEPANLLAHRHLERGHEVGGLGDALGQDDVRKDALALDVVRGERRLDLGGALAF